MKHLILLSILGLFTISTYSQSDIEGAVKIGNTSGTSDAGTIKWTGTDFMVSDGSQWTSLTTGVPFHGEVIDIDSNVYQIVLINSREWMVQNLRTTRLRNGLPIQAIGNNMQWANATESAWCWYDNDAATYELPQGKLYNWMAVQDGLLCPAGWEVPSTTDFDDMANSLGGATVAGGKLKQVGLAEWTANFGASNEGGFTAIPGGFRGNDGIFYRQGENAFYWTRDEDTAINLNAFYRDIYYASEQIFGSTAPKVQGFSVRCVKNHVQTLLDNGDSPLDIINSGFSPSDFIGLTYAGGIIFFMRTNGTGAVAAPTDQGSGQWGCEGTEISGADGVLIGTGSQNTTDIVAGCTTAGISAAICANLVLNGYVDWFLPSKDELNEMYNTIGYGGSGANLNIGGFENNIYWSSSEVDANSSWWIHVGNGTNGNAPKSTDLFIRPIREF